MKVMCQIESGALSLGSLGICLTPKQVVELSEDDLNHLDVKEAINKHWLKLEKEIRFDEVVFLNNISPTIISLQSINASIPPNKTVMTYSSALKSDDISHAISRNLIRVLPSTNIQSQEETTINEEIKIEIVKTEDNKEDIPKVEIVKMEEPEIKDTTPTIKISNTNTSELNINKVENNTVQSPVKRKRGRPRKIKPTETIEI